MIENMNDFLSIALLIGFFVGALIAFFGYINQHRIRKHIREEYYYYNEPDDVDEDL